MNSLYATNALNPLQGLVHDEDREYWRCVVHRLLVDVCTVVEHYRDLSGNLSERILADDSEDNTCRAYVLLRTTIDEIIFAYVDRTAHDI